MKNSEEILKDFQKVNNPFCLHKLIWFHEDLISLIEYSKNIATILNPYFI